MISKQSSGGMARFLHLLGQTKLYWGVLVVFAIGIFSSPLDAGGTIIFLDPGNLTDILRQVSIIGIMSVGMTLVILIRGIDLSVGTTMAFGATLAAMLLTQTGWHRGALVAVPGMCAASFLLTCFMVYRGTGPDRLSPSLRSGMALGVAALVTLAVYHFASSGLAQGFGVWGTIFAVLAVGLFVGALNGLLVARGGLQPFIVTLAMMVAVLGAARLMAGQDQSVYPIYTGVNATTDFEVFNGTLLGIPVPGVIFLAVVLVFAILLRHFRFGRHIYAVGGNETAAYLAGINITRIKITVFAISGMLAMLAGLLYAAQYRQGKPDAGTGMELDAIAAVVIGGASLMGGKGTVTGTLGGVLIFGILSNVLQLNNIDGNLQLVLKGAIIIIAVLLQESRFEIFQLLRKRKS